MDEEKVTSWPRRAGKAKYNCLRQRTIRVEVDLSDTLLDCLGLGQYSSRQVVLRAADPTGEHGVRSGFGGRGRDSAPTLCADAREEADLIGSAYRGWTGFYFESTWLGVFSVFFLFGGKQVQANQPFLRIQHRQPGLWLPDIDTNRVFTNKSSLNIIIIPPPVPRRHPKCPASNF
jgi:hypothetical protein